jgi:hydroxymethylpyrimidine/phosphomethylpyrimidine kinase
LAGRDSGRGLTVKAPSALTIAGSDSGAGAGIQADIKTFAAVGVYGTSALTAVTAQNTRGVRAIFALPPAIVAAQIEAIFEDFEVTAVKIGMLPSATVVEVVAEALLRFSPRFVALDPVMIASSGDPLIESGALVAMKSLLLPRLDCLTPNLAEAAALLGEAVARSEPEMVRQGRALMALGPRSVLVKGGHLESDQAVDVLVTANSTRRYNGPRIASSHLHGTGCTLSAAIAAHIAMGCALEDAVAGAKVFVEKAIESGRAVTLGAGSGPLMQFPLKA